MASDYIGEKWTEGEDTWTITGYDFMHDYYDMVTSSGRKPSMSGNEFRSTTWYKALREKYAPIPYDWKLPTAK